VLFAVTIVLIGRLRSSRIVVKEIAEATTLANDVGIEVETTPTQLERANGFGVDRRRRGAPRGP